MKKIIALFLILAMILSMAACSSGGGDNGNDNDDDDDNGKQNENSGSKDDGHKDDSFVTIDDNDYFLYVADYELYIVRGENDPLRLTEKLYPDIDPTDVDFWRTGFYLSPLCNLTSDSKFIIYPDRYRSDQGAANYTLSVRDLSDLKKDPVVISENVSGTYALDKDNNVVKYVKDDHSLWYYFIDKAENKMIASDIVTDPYDFAEIIFSETGKCCAYKCNNGFIYVAFADGTTSSVDCDDYGEESYHAEYVFDDGKVVYRNDRYLTVTLADERTPEGSDRYTLYYGWDIYYCSAVHAAKAPVTVVLATVADLYEANVVHDYLYIINGVELTTAESPFDFEKSFDIEISDDGQTLFYTQHLDDNHDALFKIDLSNGDSLSQEFVDSYTYKYELSVDNAPKENNADSYVYRPKTKMLLMMSDVKETDSSIEYGTLTLYTGDSKTDISENSAGITYHTGSLFGFSSTGSRILYMTDYKYSFDDDIYSGGTLNAYVNGKSTKIAENVQVILLDPDADFIY